MYLLDTATLVDLTRRKPRVHANINAHRLFPMAFSIVSYGELMYGCQKSCDVQNELNKVKQLENNYPIINTSRKIMECFGETKAILSRSGITVDDFDLLIACTALTMNYTIVTSNIKHFGKIPDLKIVNWS